MVGRYNENIRAYIRGYFYGNEVWLFSVKGYEATSMAQIADAVGVRRASLYSHFHSKEEIMEQFHNPKLAALEFHKKLVKYLIKHEVFINAGADIMAYEFFSTTYVQVNRIQRGIAKEEEAMDIIRQHIVHMCELYCK
jgi:predicted DNA-binding protein YlxM (UPF0122 family)